jgi:Dyp-type peroxidase family
MQIEVTAKGKTLQGISDLTLMAPIKPGLIDALDTRTYSSRLRLLLRTLNTGRSQAREYSSVRPFADSVERIHSIHSFRLAILDDAQPRLLLAATFDSAWEPYIRVIWRDLGPLLDVIFCNCEGYVTAFDHSYTEYAAWVRSAQLGTEFFYNATPLTVDDLQYLRQSERLHRDGPTASAADLAATGMVVADPQQVALQTVKDYPTEVVSQGMSALTALYRLADMYPPGTRDGDILLRASHQLLLEISPRPGRPSPFPPDSPVRKLFGPQIEWFERGVPDRNSPAAPTVPAPDLADVQGGIMSGYDATHGCLLLVGFDSTQALQGCLDKVIPQVSTERSDKAPGRVQMNLSFTYEGLRLAGLSDAELAGFPQEFREGMESRASVLGDVRCNHPRNWALPERNWPPADDGRKGVIERIQMSMVHMLVQLQVQSDGAAGDHALVDKHPLHDKVAELSSLLGKQLLSVQATRRNLDGSFDGKQKNMPREHFGFVDGLSQPVLDPAQAGTNWRNLMPLGELLIGHANASGDVPPHNPLWHNGSYLVVRKLRQDVAALNGVVDAAAKGTSLSRDTIKAKMMGRTPDGDALADPGKKLSNDFTYTQDATGQGCPFQAHIRRANPRTVDKPIVPRIMRRGMSYGPRYDESQPDAASNQQERGLMFMSYSASIA